MTKLDELLQAARDNGWTLTNNGNGTHAATRPYGKLGTETIDIVTTDHYPPRLHHAWATVQTHNVTSSTRYDSTDRDALIARLTTEA